MSVDLHSQRKLEELLAANRNNDDSNQFDNSMQEGKSLITKSYNDESGPLFSLGAFLAVIDNYPYKTINRKQKGGICMAGIILEMHDKDGKKYRFEYAGTRNYYPNLSSMSGYGSDEWMFLCYDAENKYILEFQASGACGYAWAAVRIPPTIFDELAMNRGEDIFEVFYSYFMNKEYAIYALHPDSIDLAKQLVGSKYSRIGKMTDKDFYG